MEEKHKILKAAMAALDQMENLRTCEGEMLRVYNDRKDDKDLPWEVNYNYEKALGSLRDAKEKIWATIGALTNYNFHIEKEGAKDE